MCIRDSTKYRTSPARTSRIPERFFGSDFWGWVPTGSNQKGTIGGPANTFTFPILFFRDSGNGAQAGDMVDITAGSGFEIIKWRRAQSGGRYRAELANILTPYVADLSVAQSVVRGRYEIIAAEGEFVCTRIPDRFPASWRQTTALDVASFPVVGAFFDASNMVLEYYRAQ